MVFCLLIHEWKCQWEPRGGWGGRTKREGQWDAIKTMEEMAWCLFFYLALWTGFEPRKSKRLDSKDKTPFQQRLWSCEHKLLLRWDLQTKRGTELGVGAGGSSSAPLLWALEDHCSNSPRDGTPGTAAVPHEVATAGHWRGSTLAWVKGNGLPKEAVGQ